MCTCLTIFLCATHFVHGSGTVKQVFKTGYKEHVFPHLFISHKIKLLKQEVSDPFLAPADSFKSSNHSLLIGIAMVFVKESKNTPPPQKKKDQGTLHRSIGIFKVFCRCWGRIWNKCFKAQRERKEQACQWTSDQYCCSELGLGSRLTGESMQKKRKKNQTYGTGNYCLSAASLNHCGVTLIMAWVQEVWECVGLNVQQVLLHVHVAGWFCCDILLKRGNWFFCTKKTLRGDIQNCWMFYW